MNALFSSNQSTRYREQVSQHIAWGHWFLLGNILLGMSIAIRYILATPFPDTGMGQLYLLVSWIGHFGYIGFILFLLTIFPLSFLVTNHRILRGAAILIAAVLQILLLIDTQVYQLLKFHLNPYVWNLLVENSQSKSSLNWNFLFIAIQLIIALEIVFSSLAWKRQFRRARPWQGRTLTILFVCCFLATHLIHIWADANLYLPITAQKSNFPLSYPMTARSFLARHGWLDKQTFDAQRANAANQLHRRLVYPLAPLQVSPSDNHPNLLLITLHGLRADMVNNVVMPNLSRLAGQSQRFTQQLSADNERETSLFSLFYGLPASYMDDMLADHRSPLLLDELQRQDYQIKIFSSQNLKQPLYRNGIFGGVRQFRSHKSDGDEQASIQHLLSWLPEHANGPRPWFAYLQLDTPGNLWTPSGLQGPFQPELTQLDPFNLPDNSKRNLVVNRYKNSAFLTDQMLGQLFDRLDDLKLTERTVIVITADHGFALSDRGQGQWGAGDNYDEAQLAVPLIISWPGKAASEYQPLSSHVDLAPTLLQELLGVTSSSSDFSTGTSLYQGQPHSWVLAGNNQQFVIITPEEITQFDRQGHFEVRDKKHYQLLDDSRPDMPMLLKVMRDLSRFRSGPESDASNRR